MESVALPSQAIWIKGSAFHATPRYSIVLRRACILLHTGHRHRMSTLRQAIVSEEEQEWALVQPTLTKKQTERAERNWRRLMIKLGFCITVTAQEQLLNLWEDRATAQSSGSSRTLPEDAPKKSKNVSRNPRRDDLDHVGDPMPPTDKKYIIDRTKCIHRHEDGRSMLTAGGGRGASGPMYWWVCQGCGSRWKRITKEEAKEPPAPPAEPPPPRSTKKPLQPRLTPDDRRTPEPNPREEKFQENDVEMELIPGPSTSATGSGNPNP